MSSARRRSTCPSSIPSPHNTRDPESVPLTGARTVPISPDEWFLVPGFEGRFWVNTAGECRGASGRIIGTPDKDGYIVAGYAKPDGGGRTVAVHILVAAAFLGPRPDDHEVDHKNQRRWDNRPENLQYLPKSENAPRRGDSTADPKRWRAEAEGLREYTRYTCSACGDKGHNRQTCSAAEPAIAEPDRLESGEFDQKVAALFAELTPPPEVLPRKRTLRGRIRQATAALRRAVRS